MGPGALSIAGPVSSPCEDFLDCTSCIREFGTVGPVLGRVLGLVCLSRKYRQIFFGRSDTRRAKAIQQLRCSAICAVTLRFSRVIQLTRWRHCSSPARLTSVIRRTLKKSAPAACRHDHMIRGHCLQIPEQSRTPYLHRSSHEMLRQTRSKVKTCRRAPFKLSRARLCGPPARLSRRTDTAAATASCPATCT